MVATQSLTGTSPGIHRGSEATLVRYLHLQSDVLCPDLVVLGATRVTPVVLRDHLAIYRDIQETTQR